MMTNTIVKLKECSAKWQQKNESKSESNGAKVILRYLTYMIAFVFLVLAISPIYEVGAATLSIKVDGVVTSYTGKQVNVTFNGSDVNMKKTPGIVINGTSYVSYKNVFGDSKIGASVSYNSKKKTITMKKYDNTLVMTLGSTSATLNGTKVTMPAAPIKVTYVDKKVTKILVPTEFVATSLGYGYSWSASTDTVTAEIRSGFMIKYDGRSYSYTGTQPNITLNGETIDLSTLPAIILDNSVILQAKKVFASTDIGAKYNYDKTSKTVTLTRDDIVITMTLGSKTANVNGTSVEMPTSVRMIKNMETGKSYVCVPAEFISNTFGINYRWDSATKTSVIVVEDDVEETPEDSKPSTGDDTTTGNDTTTGDDTTTGADTTTGNDSTTGNESQTKPEDSNTGTGTDSDQDSGTTTTPENNGSGNGSTSSETDSRKVLTTYQMMNQYYETFTRLEEGVATSFNSSVATGIGYINNVMRTMDANVDREVYTIQSQLPFTNITSNKENNIITITADNMMGDTILYPFYLDMVTSIQTLYHPESLTMDFIVTLTDPNLAYELSLSTDLKTLTLIVYSNYLETIEISTSNINDAITIHSLNGIVPTITETDTSLMFVIPNTMNTIGEVSYSSPELTKITGMSLTSVNNNDSLIIITRTPNAAYTITKAEDGSYIISFPVEKSTTGNVSDNTTTEQPSEDKTDGTGTTTGSNSTGATVKNLSYTAVKIPMPSGYTIDDVTNEDLYLDKQIKIYLPGNQTGTITKSTITKKSSYVSKVEVNYVNGETVITLTTSRVCGFDYIVKDGYLCLAIDTPSKVYSNIVLLDPGHGGAATGAISSTKVMEKDLNFKILYTLASSMFEECGIKAYYTRTTDEDMYLYDRPKYSAQVEADLFISLHMNSVTNAPTAKGTEVFYYASEKATMNGLTGKQMATIFSSNLSSILGTTNRGAKLTRNLVVLKYNTVPSVLIELGFLSNSTDLAKLVSPTYQKRAAESIVATICEFFETYPTGR